MLRNPPAPPSGWPHRHATRPPGSPSTDHPLGMRLRRPGDKQISWVELAGGRGSAAPWSWLPPAVDREGPGWAGVVHRYRIARPTGRLVPLAPRSLTCRRGRRHGANSMGRAAAPTCRPRWRPVQVVEWAAEIRVSPLKTDATCRDGGAGDGNRTRVTSMEGASRPVCETRSSATRAAHGGSSMPLSTRGRPCWPMLESGQVTGLGGLADW
jgi:hypothetical protein